MHDPAVILKNYKLIFYFLTAPICKDPVTIGKILGMLSDNIISPNGHQTLFNSCDMMLYEKIVSEIHFKKLILISKLVMMSLRSENNHFKFIEINQKKINPSRVISDNQNENLPQKFQKEDKERIIEHFSYDITQALIKNSMMALQDCMLLTSMPKQSLKSSMRDLTFIRGTSRSAYNHETVEKAI